VAEVAERCAKRGPAASQKKIILLMNKADLLTEEQRYLSLARSLNL
jgi:ribosome biogenesis GTPase A